MNKKQIAYRAYFKDPRWQKLRLKIMERDDFKCQLCDDRKSTLNVHHRYYLSGKKPWEYPKQALVTLCEACHVGETVGMNDSCRELEKVFRTKFLSPEIGHIAFIFESCHFPVDADTVPYLLDFWFNDKKNMKFLVDKYISSVEDKPRKKKGN